MKRNVTFVILCWGTGGCSTHSGWATLTIWLTFPGTSMRLTPWSQSVENLLLHYHAWMWTCLEFSRVNLWRPFEFSQIGEPWTRLTIFPSRVSPCTGWKSVTISFLLMNLWSRTLRNWGRYNVSGQNHSDCRWNDTVGLGVCNIWKEHVFLSKFESFE